MNAVRVEYGGHWNFMERVGQAVGGRARCLVPAYGVTDRA